MPIDDDADEGAGLGPPPPADDRLWRHPSELSGTAPVQIVTRRPPRRRALTIGVLSGLAGAAVMLAVLMASGAMDHKATTVAVEQVKQPLPAPDQQVAQVTAKVLPGLARVDAVGATGTTSATAVVFRTDGFLLTTADAVNGAKSLTAQLPDGTTMPATLVGIDTSSDVAVVRVARTQMHAAVLSDEDDIVLGEPALSIDCVAGRPSDPDVSVGLVTALGRRTTSASGVALPDMIQTDAHPTGNDSAAVLVDSTGAVLGVITANPGKAGTATTTAATASTATTSSPTATDATGASLVLRYATPIDYASRVADQIIANGRATHPWLGVETSDLTGDQLAETGHAGARIDQVITPSPAQHAGLQTGDVVTAIDGSAVASSTALTVALRNDQPHQVVHLTYLRNGVRHTTQATLADRSTGQ